MGELRDDLYYFKKKAIPVTIASKVDHSVILWHKHFGLVPFEKLYFISQMSSLSLKTLNKCCDSCHRAKPTRKAFFLFLSFSKCENLFDLVHIDV